MKAEIICVGRELLIGDVLNTNATYLSNELTNLGIDVCYQTTIGDKENIIIDTTLNAINKSDIIIFTGGLGPTKDDLTKESVAKALDVELIEDGEILKDIKDKFSSFNSEMTPNNRKQALIPKGGRPLINKMGTAPGITIKRNNTLIFLLPGPPKEMQHVFVEKVKPLLMNNCADFIINKVIKTISIGESKLESVISGVIDKYKNLTIATYAKGGQVDLHIESRSKSKIEAIKLVNKAIKDITPLIDEYIYSYEDKNIEEVVYELLLKKKKIVGFCESCTGGLISSRFSKIAGVSSVFDRGIVTYSNTSKIEELGVNPLTIKKHGAVSKETAVEMAKGLLKRNSLDISLSVTGIAGPSGGTEEKPVGLVYVGLATRDKIDVFKYNFSGDRETIQKKVANQAFNIIRKYLLNLN